MPGIARVGIDTAGGTITGSPQSFARVGGALVACVGATVAGHGTGAHAAPVMAQGSAFARINGIAICRAGDAASCGDAATGASWARVGA